MDFNLVTFRLRLKITLVSMFLQLFLPSIPMAAQDGDRLHEFFDTEAELHQKCQQLAVPRSHPWENTKWWVRPRGYPTPLSQDGALGRFRLGSQSF